MRDLQSAYHGNLHGSGPLYSDYIAYISRREATQSLGYWTSLLGDVSPCYFPNLSTTTTHELKKIIRVVPRADALRGFCRANGTSIANLFQLAWALVLRAFTESDNVCFGYLTSGRDVPIDRIEDTLGPFINLLVCHVDFETNRSVGDILETIKESYIDSLPHQQCSLADIQHELGVSNKGLFNTGLSLQRTPSVIDSQNKIQFEGVVAHDPSEV